MKKIKLLTIAVLFSTIISAQISGKEEEAVQQTVENTFAALSVLDTTLLKTFVTGNVRFYEYGELWTLDTLIKKLLPYRSTPGFKRTNSFKYVKTTIREKTAWVTYYLQSVLTINGEEQTVNWMETVILVKENKQWKVELLHSTRLNKN